MNAFSLAAASIRARALHASLCVLACAAGFALLSGIFLMTQSIEGSFLRNAQGIDIVVGAKGSPLQLVLASVYHDDVPTGNIEAEDADKITRNPKVAQAIPLALGDNYKGYRIVGTTPDYMALYGATLARGSVFEKPFDAVAGSLTGLEAGTEFAGVHGLSADSDDVHHFHLYRITGVMKPSGTVLDRLILTQVKSVQELHSHPDADDPDAADEMKVSHQVTALLLRVKSPIAVMSLPREINKTSNMLAANPGYEMARLSQNLGFGRDLLTALGAGFIALSALMLLSSLASGLSARRYDLGVLRVLGASPLTLSLTVIAEGIILSAAGTLLGVALGHLAAYAAATHIQSLQGLMLPAQLLAAQPMDAGFLAMGVAAGLAAGLVPALAAARTDIAGLLARAGMKIVVLLGLAGLLCASPAFALKKENPKDVLIRSETTVTGTIDLGTMILDAPTRKLSDYVKDYVDIPKGGVDWKLFGSTKEIKVEGKDKEGFDYGYVKPEFPKPVKALDGQDITLKGFMFPLDAADDQKLFLFGPFPVGCPFHYHVTPSLVVEVHADKTPVAFSYDPIVLKGRLELVSKDPENSTFYRLVDARQVKEEK